MKKVLECVPNISEGRNGAIIEKVANAVRKVEGVKLLHIDAGESTNRTVFTFAGEPEQVIEAVFRLIEQTAELIDMQSHKGSHPRMGATDVCPLVPISGITIAEAVALSQKLGQRVANELNIPVYLYEYSATAPYRKSLADIRSGEYEGFEQKIRDPQWKPDYGKAIFNRKSGQTVIGVRDFLVAYNVNLNTKSVRRANSVAFDIRESGRVKKENGKTVLDGKGEAVREAGKLKHCRGIGWYIEEYGFAQVSLNLTNINETALHTVFEAADESARARGLRITGSELVGLVPKQSLIDAGVHFLSKQNRSIGVPESEVIDYAIHSLGLNEIKPFVVKERVIEYLLEEPKPKLIDLTVRAFCEKVGSESAAPGGGSVGALCAALGVSLGQMVANLSANKSGWDDKITVFSTVAQRFQALQDRLLSLVDEDTAAFNEVLSAYGLPKGSEKEKAIRADAIEKANQGAALIPLEVMKTAFKAYSDLLLMVTDGNPNSITDAGVGSLCLSVGIQATAMNVAINLKSIKDKNFIETTKTSMETIMDEAMNAQDKIMEKLATVMD